VKFFFILFNFYFLLAIFPALSRAQEGNIFNLNIDNGLPSNHVYGAITDRHGYLWIATPNGVARYNGYDFKLFNLSEGLPYEDIWELLEDKKGRIWLGNISNEIGYIYNNKYHKAYVENQHGTISPRNIRVSGNGIVFWSYYISGNQDITICTENNDTFHSQVINKFMFSDEARKRELASAQVQLISLFYIKNEHEKYIIYGGDIYELNTGNKKISIIKEFSLNQLLPSKQLTSNKIVFLNDCLVAFKENKQSFFSTVNLKNNDIEKISLEGLGTKEKISHVLYPKDNNDEHYFYVITKHDIFQFQDLSNIKYIKRMPIKNMLDGEKATVYNKNGVWMDFLGTETKGFFLNINVKDNFKKYNFNLTDYKYVGGERDHNCFWWNNTTNTLLNIDKWKINKCKYESFLNVYGIIPYNRDTFLIQGTLPFYLNRNTGNISKELDYKIQNIYAVVLHNNTMFIISSNGFFERYFKDNKYVSNVLDEDRYRHIIYDSLRQNVWAYNYDKVFIHNIDGKNQIITNNQVERFGIKKIESITIDNKYGNIFFKGQNNITIYNSEKNVYQELFKNFNLKESSVYVYNNTLIIAGRFGVLFDKILGPDKLSKSLLYNNFKNTNYNFIRDCQISWGALLLNTDKGVYEVNIPTDSEIINSPKDSLFNRYNVILNYRDSVSNINTGDTIQINQKDLRLQFDIINPAGNGQLKYNYKLPNDSGWHELNTNELNLPSFTPDNYYKITIAAHDNVWRSDEIDLYIHVQPYWWQTHTGKRIVWVSAIALILLFLTALILVTRKLAIRATQKRNLQMEMELKSIYSQINPHFIFNTLNSALLLVSKNRMEEAYSHITKFSKLLRSYIKSSRNKFITIAEEISNLRNYIELQQTRFKSKFEYSIAIDENIASDQVKIPSLLLQPFVENAINHGILNREGAGNLKIEFRNSERKNEIECIIDDDGIGRKNSKLLNQSNTDRGESYGDLLIKDLVSIFNKYEQMNIEITYTDKMEPLTGTIVTIKIKKS